MNQEKLETISSELGELLKLKDYSFTCAESCTGGWVGHALTSIPGSSEWFGSSFVTYSYEAKTQILGVSSEDLDNFGAVSEEIVEQMVCGALHKSGANVGVAISGIAGPAGATDTKPVGTVCFAWKMDGQDVITSTEYFAGERNEIRYSSVERALMGTIELVKKN
ncbi:MAG: competence damage-inducible protein A [Gammaproteobacteria bacterium]|nr:CinA family protein [SAR86 cluster bacterium]GIT61537.1 MAG: competence damage-inducible protein A [Gammaproteobacteria bacterium]